MHARWLLVKCLVACAAGGLGTSPLRAELRHHWPLDETQGLTATDIASGADATLAGFANDDDDQWVDGAVGGGLSLATGGSLRNHLVTEIPAMDASVTGGFTIMMWINPGPQVGRVGEYQLFNAPGDAIGFTIYNDVFDGITHRRVLLFWDGSVPHILVGRRSLSPGRWYHVAVTSTGVGGERKLYVDGIEEIKRFFVAQGGVDAGHANGWAAGTARIGAFNDVGGRWHDSILDDVRIYDSVLSEEEIAQAMNDAPPETRFVRGDANADGEINLTDGIVILNHLYVGGDAPACMDAADVDDSGGDLPAITDAIRLFNWLYTGGPPPAAPTPTAPQYGAEDCGPDATADDLTCETSAGICE